MANINQYHTATLFSFYKHNFLITLNLKFVQNQKVIWKNYDRFVNNFFDELPTKLKFRRRKDSLPLVPRPKTLSILSDQLPALYLCKESNRPTT